MKVPAHWQTSGVKARPGHFSHRDLSKMMEMNVVLTIVSLTLGCFPSAIYACDEADADSLLSFASIVSSSPSLNWSNSIDCCLWEGITCNSDLTRVTRLWLPSRGLRGPVAPSLANVNHLTHLNLYRNSLFGSLPPGFFSSLNNLQIIDFSHNDLSGKLPSSSSSSSRLEDVNLSSNRMGGDIPSWFLKGAWNLSSFDVSSNQFTGVMPSHIWINSSRSIQFLDFSMNYFSGEIPRGLGSCLNLKVFRAGSNSLKGSLPHDLHKSASIEELSVPQNQLSGPIDEAIANVTNLRIIELSSNGFTGPILAETGKLYNLQQLLLQNNRLNGSLPSSLMDCTNLMLLNLRSNSLLGDLSTFNFSKLVQLRVLDLGYNDFSGNFPQSLFSCKSLTAVRLSANRIAGHIPPEISHLQSLSFMAISRSNLSNIAATFTSLMGCRNLTAIILSHNFIGESMPEVEMTVNLRGFQNLELLALVGCQLQGRVPAWLATLRNLRVLDLSQNRLTGQIPPSFSSLPYLFYIDLSSNLLSGLFPKQLTLLPALSGEMGNSLGLSPLVLPIFVVPDISRMRLFNGRFVLPPAIYLDSNGLSGSIPVEIGQLKSLHVLSLSRNHFYGSIPDEIAQVTILERLDLSSNSLTGKIPASLVGLHFLSSFSIAFNDLDGEIPSGGQFDTFPSASFEGNPKLCGSIVQRPCFTQEENDAPEPKHAPEPEDTIVGLAAGLSFGFIVGSTCGFFYMDDFRRFIARFTKFF
ncbi:hypothetical protein BT93_C2470 [Corymbia citriodora subsp. variegata]|nr:hypothetical protein BT93_C2470 [Corymbia citriodora subsp. variegata]